MKILIGCPTAERYEYCVEIWLKRVEEIIDFSKHHQIEYLLVDNSKSEEFFKKWQKEGVKMVKAPYFEDVKERIIHSRNILRDKALNEGFDIFLSLEQDVIPPTDVIERLLRHNKKIISAYYGKPLGLRLQDQETGEIKDVIVELPLVYLQDGDKIRRANPQEVLKRGLIKVGAFGVGCLAIQREVLEKVKFRYEKGKEAFDDMFFCSDAKKLGYELFLDSDVKVVHLHQPWENANS